MPGMPSGALPAAPAAPPPAPTQPPGSRAHLLWRVDVPTRTAHVATVAQVDAQLAELARTHPDRARLLDIGDSTRKELGLPGGHDIRALVLGSRPDDPAVPRIVFTAGVHPRETANTALLTEWATSTLTAAAAGDPARRALLDQRTIVVVPIVNPDTHAMVVDGLERGHEPSIWRRTNQRPGGGVDLNRNFDNRWGAGATTPGERTYRGPYPASEPEVRAVQQLGHALQPDAVYDLHSPGGVVLVPHGSQDAWRAAQLVARATGYAVTESAEHWRRSVGGGTVKDWARDQLGATALTIETGAVHHQSDEQYADTRARMLPALDALAATVDGSQPPPAAAAALAAPAPADRFVAREHLQGVVVEPWNDPADRAGAIRSAHGLSRNASPSPSPNHRPA